MKMRNVTMEKVKRLSGEVKTVYVATAGRTGVPHIAASEGMTFVNGDKVFFSAWFCHKTVENLRVNPEIALALLNPETREGYQLLGKVDAMERGAMLNGFSPEKEREWAALPQVEHRLSIRVEEVLHLTSGPHSDEAIEGD